MLINSEFLRNALIFITIIFMVFGTYFLITVGNSKVDEKYKIVFNFHKIKKTTILILILLGIAALFSKYPIIYHTINTLLIGIVFSYIINPLVKYIEKKGVKRSIAILIIYVIVILLIILLGMIVVPQTIQQIKKMIISLPGFMSDISVKLNAINNKIFKEYPNVSKIMSNAMQTINQKLGTIQTSILDKLSQTGDVTGNIFSNLLRIVLVPVVSFYMLLDKEKCIDFIMGFIPNENKDKFLSICSDMDKAYSEFIRGRLIMAIFVGVLTAIALIIMKVDFAIIIGILTMVGDIIPYIGPFIAVTPAFILAFLDSPLKAVVVVIVFVSIQWVENNILAPKLLGSKIGINPLLVIVSLIIGGGMFGVVGMILSVPFVATVKILYLHFKDKIKMFFKN